MNDRRPEQEAARVLERARAEYAALEVPWDNYRIDVELVGSLVFELGVQRVEDLRVGDRAYAGFLDANSRLIAIEETHHPHRQRFSIAHEIGHYVLHYHPGEAFICTDADMEADVRAARAGDPLVHLRQEAEANRFAGALLMPEPAVRALHRVTGGRILQLSKHFDVSPQAVELRLNRLGLKGR